MALVDQKENRGRNKGDLSRVEVEPQTLFFVLMSTFIGSFGLSKASAKNLPTQNRGGYYFLKYVSTTFILIRIFIMQNPLLN